MVILKYDYLVIPRGQVVSRKSLLQGKTLQAFGRTPEGYIPHTAVHVWDRVRKDFPNVKLIVYKSYTLCSHLNKIHL